MSESTRDVEVYWRRDGQKGKANRTVGTLGGMDNEALTVYQTLYTTGEMEAGRPILRKLIDAAYYIGGDDNGKPVVWPDGKLAR